MLNDRRIHTEESGDFDDVATLIGGENTVLPSGVHEAAEVLTVRRCNGRRVEVTPSCHRRERIDLRRRDDAVGHDPVEEIEVRGDIRVVDRPCVAEGLRSGDQVLRRSPGRTGERGGFRGSRLRTTGRSRAADLSQARPASCHGLAQQAKQELRRSLGIVLSAVGMVQGDGEVLTAGAQRSPGQVQAESCRQGHRAERRDLRYAAARACELGIQEREVESAVVGNHHGALQASPDIVRDGLESRGSAHGIAIEPVHPSSSHRDSRIDQRDEAIHDPASRTTPQHRDLDDPVAAMGREPGRLDVDDHVVVLT